MQERTQNITECILPVFTGVAFHQLGFDPTVLELTYITNIR